MKRLALLASVDSSVAEWGDRHATAWSHDGLTLVTTLGETWTVVGPTALSATPASEIVPFSIQSAADAAATAQSPARRSTFS